MKISSTSWYQWRTNHPSLVLNIGVLVYLWCTLMHNASFSKRTIVNLLVDFQVQIVRFGWKWKAYPRWNEIFLWGPRQKTCVIWDDIMSNNWHDCTRGAWGLLLFTCLTQIYFQSDMTFDAEGRVYHTAWLETIKSLENCFWSPFQSWKAPGIWRSGSVSTTPSPGN